MICFWKSPSKSLFFLVIHLPVSSYFTGPKICRRIFLQSVSFRPFFLMATYPATCVTIGRNIGIYFWESVEKYFVSQLIVPTSFLIYFFSINIYIGISIIVWLYWTRNISLLRKDTYPHYLFSHNLYTYIHSDVLCFVYLRKPTFLATSSSWPRKAIRNHCTIYPREPPFVHVRQQCHGRHIYV